MTDPQDASRRPPEGAHAGQGDPGLHGPQDASRRPPEGAHAGQGGPGLHGPQDASRRPPEGAHAGQGDPGLHGPQDASRRPPEGAHAGQGDPGRHGPEFALELRDVRKSFGKTEIIRGASLQVRPGERVAVIGPNGAGKSTLFNLISGRFRSTSGDILLHGQKLDGMAPYEINRKGLARSFQVSNLFTRLSVFENLRCAVLWSLGYRYSFWRFLAEARDANDRAEEVLDMIKLHKRRDVLAMNLTYAEQRALEIGITIAGGASVILLDEPTAGMSRSETARFVNLIRDITVGKTLLTVEHDMGVVFGLADKIAVLVYGEVIAFDTPEKVRADDRVKEAYLGSVLADAQAAGAGH